MLKRVVIKLGGASLSESAVLEKLASLVKGYRESNIQVVIVHGGGPAINQELTNKGITWEFVNGQRKTTPEMMTVIEDVLAHQVNQYIVSSLQNQKITAVGLSGASGLLECRVFNSELGLVGEVTQCHLGVVEKALDQHLIPVIAPIGFDHDGRKFNINADWAASQIAATLNADKLIFLTDQLGILDADKKVCPTVTVADIENMINHGVIAGGMLTKTKAMMSAKNKGVAKVQISAAAHAPDLLTNDAAGTNLI